MTESTFTKNLALVGAGSWGKNLARNFYNLGALHTLCDAKESILDSYEEKYPGTHVTSNYGSIMENPLVTRVAIAAPAPLHYDLAKQALIAGKDVYVEKPLCLDASEAEELIKLADERGLILMTGHLLQYHPCVEHLKMMVKRGDIGKLQYIVSNRLNLGAIRTEENALWNFAPHDISVILALCGDQLPYRVRTMGAAYLSKGVADTSMTAMRFDNDVRAQIYVSWLNPYKEQRLVVIGSAGMIVFDDTKEWEEKLLYYPDHVRWTEGKTPEPNNKVGKKVEVPQSEPLRNECVHFLTCCDERKIPRTDGQEGLRVLNVLQAAQASLNEDGAAKDPHEKHEICLVSKPDYFVHPSSVVDAGAKIGSGSKIWHFSHIMGQSRIGSKCNIGQNVFVASGVTLGNNVKIQNNVSIYTGMVCEDDVFLGPSAVFTNIVNPRSAVSRRHQYKATVVRKGCTVGANATVVCGVELGEYSFIGAGAVVTKDVKPYSLVVGNPAKQMGWMSRFGERLELSVSTPEGERESVVCPKTGDVYSLEGDTLTLVTEGHHEPTPAVNEISTSVEEKRPSLV